MAASAARVDEVRRFNRFYTRTIGVLAKGQLGSPFSLAELRVLYEIAHGTQPTAAEIGAALDLDAGYLSRILGRFVRAGLVVRTRSRSDGRQAHLELTGSGRARFSSLDRRARADVGRLLDGLSEEQQRAVTAAMGTIQSALGSTSAEARPAAEVRAAEVVLREPRPGDLGWVLQRHGEFYGREFGWNAEFEGLVARILADFVEHYDAAREHAWIAERDGEKLGSVFLVKESARVARLRCLLVEPQARGLGLGTRLVDTCTEFARAAGYRKIVLLTDSLLVAARRIYARAGYRLVSETRRPMWGKEEISETWELNLR